MPRPLKLKVTDPNDPDAKTVIVMPDGRIVGVTTDAAVTAIYHVAVQHEGWKCYSKNRYQEMVRLAKALGMVQDHQPQQKKRKKGESNERSVV